jgi:hypothetical protein
MWMPFVALAAALGGTSPDRLVGLADPMAFVAERYRIYQRGERGHGSLGDYASPRLLGHLDDFNAAMGGEELDSLDVWIDDRDDWRLTRLELSLAPSRDPDRQMIVARFLNESRPVRLHFHFVRTVEGWALDELVKPGPGGWTLTQRLASRPTASPDR